ncbi:hypothetical protein HZH68_006777 [Vespula germanica]|uniref:Uncharacterized protein n=1 Tax=Vespula germanica TaxID=30212 RepID=A0A834NE04_VESGE|nr:hypothetical protein HZH68_006777 [Vespula germanica]
MGLPRLSLKRCFLYVFCLTGMLLVLMNVRQKEIWHAMRSDPVQVQSLRGLGDTTKCQISVADETVLAFEIEEADDTDNAYDSRDDQEKRRNREKEEEKEEEEEEEEEESRFSRLK